MRGIQRAVNHLLQRGLTGEEELSDVVLLAVGLEEDVGLLVVEAVDLVHVLQRSLVLDENVYWQDKQVARAFMWDFERIKRREAHFYFTEL